jgi:hypothetical protein
MLDANLEGIAPEERQILVEKVDKLTRAGSYVSDYATTDSKEMLAEAWTEFITSPKPREPARLVGETFREWLA